MLLRDCQVIIHTLTDYLKIKTFYLNYKLNYLCEYKALVNAYKCEITEKSYFLFMNGYKLSLLSIKSMI